MRIVERERLDGHAPVAAHRTQVLKVGDTGERALQPARCARPAQDSGSRRQYVLGKEGGGGGQGVEDGDVAHGPMRVGAQLARYQVAQCCARQPGPCHVQQAKPYRRR